MTKLVTSHDQVSDEIMFHRHAYLQQRNTPAYSVKCRTKISVLDVHEVRENERFLYFYIFINEAKRERVNERERKRERTIF